MSERNDLLIRSKDTEKCPEEQKLDIINQFLLVFNKASVVDMGKGTYT